MDRIKETVKVDGKEPVASSEPVKWGKKKCRVVNYVPSMGILGFDFDGIPCQISVGKNLDFGSEVVVKFRGEIGKDIIFSL